ncbi:LysR family transcriptional regulator [Brenneria populi]|uniref:LysR family transcriptional regulator n=1 Tax=Brenneria populi TaxID=1505588 RepID=A0ABU6JTK6_9GAMM|nr:LysR family transcriptional regulator [Brenneria populi Li et al. 2015]
MTYNLATGLGDRRITLEHLRAFVSIAEVNGFVDASFILNRSQSAITQSLQKLEEILGCKLVERSKGHAIGLTREGKRFLAPAKDILMRLTDATSALQQLSMSGRVRLGVPDDFNIVDIHGALSRCLGNNQHLAIQITSDLSAHILKSLLSDALDVAILEMARGEPLPNHLALCRALRSEPLHWVANASVHYNDITRLSLVTFPEGCTYRRVALRTLENSGKAVDIVYTSASDENIRKAVSAGLGITVLPASAIADDHIILDHAFGFPSLPEVELILAANDENHLFLQFSQFLERTVLLNNNRVGVKK